VYALSYAFRHPERAITALKTAFGCVDLDDAGLLTKETADDFFTQVPLFRDFLNRVVILKRSHSSLQSYAIRTSDEFFAPDLCELDFSFKFTNLNLP